MIFLVCVLAVTETITLFLWNRSSARWQRLCEQVIAYNRFLVRELQKLKGIPVDDPWDVHKNLFWKE